MQMTTTQNAYNFIDYKIPIGTRIRANNDDTRSAYTRAHQNYSHHEKVGDAPSRSITNNVCDILQRKEMPYDYRSESSKQYTWKEADRQSEQANLAIHLRRPHFAQSMEQRCFRAPPKPIRTTSSYTNDYDVKSIEVTFEPMTVDILCKGPEPPTASINAGQPGHYKYLDPYATTTMLAYPMHEHNGIARKDGITVWDWYELPKGKGFGLATYPVKRKSFHVPVYDSRQFGAPIYDRILPNTAEIVPHNGMMSEQRGEYGIPVERKVERSIVEHLCMSFNEHHTLSQFDAAVYAVQPHPIPPTSLRTGTTEYTLYGSGNKIDKFLKQN